VAKRDFVESLLQNPVYLRYKEQLVRTEKYQDLPVETIEQTVTRMLNEAEGYLSIDEIIDFFTFKGRPELLLKNLRLHQE